MCGFNPHKMAENRGLLAPPTPPVGVTTVKWAVGALISEKFRPSGPFV